MLITSVSVINYLRILQSGCEKELRVIRKLNEKRISNLFITNTCLFRNIKPISGENIITDEIKNNILEGRILLILLDKFECNKCQENELIRLNSVRQILSEKGIEVLGLITQSQKDVVIRQRKISKINFPIYWVEDGSFFNNLAVHKEFPQILLVSNNIILSAFIPVPQDDKFSEDFYRDLLSRIAYNSI